MRGRELLPSDRQGGAGSNPASGSAVPKCLTWESADSVLSPAVVPGAHVTPSTHGPSVDRPGEVREMTLIGIAVLAAVLIAAATLLALGLCAAGAARDEMESGVELPIEAECDHSSGPQRTVNPPQARWMRRPPRLICRPMHTGGALGGLINAAFVTLPILRAEGVAWPF